MEVGAGLGIEQRSKRVNGETEGRVVRNMSIRDGDLGLSLLL